MDANILSRQERFSVGQYVMVWTEKIQSKRVLPAGELLAKLHKSWQFGLVTKCSDDIYYVATKNANRRLHRRQMKKLPDIHLANAKRELRDVVSHVT